MVLTSSVMVLRGSLWMVWIHGNTSALPPTMYFGAFPCNNMVMTEHVSTRPDTHVTHPRDDEGLVGPTDSDADIKTHLPPCSLLLLLSAGRTG